MSRDGPRRLVPETADKVEKAEEKMFVAFLARGLTRGTCENCVLTAYAVALTR